MFPDVKIPKYDGDYDLLFKEYADQIGESTGQKSTELQSEMSKVEEINAKLTEEISELKKTNELMVRRCVGVLSFRFLLSSFLLLLTICSSMTYITME